MNSENEDKHFSEILDFSMDILSDIERLQRIAELLVKGIALIEAEKLEEHINEPDTQNETSVNSRARDNSHS